MRRLSYMVILSIVLFSFVRVPDAWAISRVNESARGLSTVAMASLSPLLSVSIMGIKERVTAPEGTALPFHARTEFLAFALVLLLLLLCKDTLGELFPVAKKPLDALDVIQNKAIGIACAAAILPNVAAAGKGMVALGILGAWNMVEPAVAHASSDAASSVPAWIDAASWWFSYALGIVAFYSIWCASHVVNVLGLLSPVPLVGPVLKALRLGLLATLAMADAAHPLLGLAFSVLILFTAVKTTGWATRLMVFGTLCGYDILARRWRNPIQDGPTLAFSASGSFGLPKRMLGYLSKSQAELSFSYMPFFLPPKRTRSMPTPEGLAVAKAMACPVVIAKSGKSHSTIFILPPRYRGHEQDVAARLGCGVAPSAFGRSIRVALAWVKSLRRQAVA